nr:LD-carboxypeptidase [Actinomycetales bacterium]
MLTPGARIALVNSSNACPPHEQALVPELVRYLEGLGLTVDLSPFVMPRYAADFRSEEGPRPWDWAHAGSDRERASALMRAFADPGIKAVFDISGGDLANGVLHHLDWDVIRANPKPYAGYSDLSTHLGAFLAETGRPQIYWRILSLGGTPGSGIGDGGTSSHGGSGSGDGGTSSPDGSRSRRVGSWGAGYGDARTRFEQTFLNGDSHSPADCVPKVPTGPLFELDDVHFIRGSSMSGPLVGGNLRCTLKLAGTRWFPELDGAILAIESESNPAPLITTLLTQYRDLGAFERCAGLLIGQHNHLTAHYGPHAIEQILDSIVDTDIPVARTEQFGHRHDSRALLIGANYELDARSAVAAPTRT